MSEGTDLLARGTEVTIHPDTVLCYGLSAGPWVVRASKPAPDEREAKKDRPVRIWVEVSDPTGETWSIPREKLTPVVVPLGESESARTQEFIDTGVIS